MKSKAIITILGIIFFICGFFGIFLTMNFPVTGRIGRFYDQLPMGAVNRIVVDSSGNIYVGVTYRSSIQVYDNTGMFLYRFSFPGRGGTYFTFYIDNDDIVHVAVAREHGVFSFKNGYLIGEREFIHANEIADIRNQSRREYVDNEGNVYIIQRTRSVRMYDAHGNFIRRIAPHTPLRLLSPPVMLLVTFLGVVMVVAANRIYLVTLAGNKIKALTESKDTRLWWK